jgi:hypothetical protein
MFRCSSNPGPALSRLFISHSSKDNVEALAFRRWLAANGWAESDVFIDLHGIGAGARWRETLRKANVACEAVVLLASPNSLASVECEKELELAEALAKPIIPAIVRSRNSRPSPSSRSSTRASFTASGSPSPRSPRSRPDLPTSVSRPAVSRGSRVSGATARTPAPIPVLPRSGNSTPASSSAAKPTLSRGSPSSG